MEYTKKTIHDIPVHYQQTSQFKTILVSCKFISTCEAQTINQRSLLPELLTGATKKYPNRSLIQSELSGLYGTEISASTQKIGMQSVISFDMAFVNEKFLPGHPQIFTKAFKMLSDIIYNPKLYRGSFKKSLFVQEKRMLLEELKTEYHDKFSYSYTRFKQLMFKDELFRYSARGDLDTLPELSLEDMNKAYSQMLKNDLLEIFVVGDFSEIMLDEAIAENFSTKQTSIDATWLDMETKTIQDIEQITEYGEVFQSRIFLGYRTPIQNLDPLYYAMMLNNVILGDSDQAKLFLDIREKNQLSYDISSTYLPNKGVLFVFAGTEIGKESELIAKVQTIISGIDEASISEDDLTLAKETLKKRVLQGNDSLVHIINRTFFSLQLFKQEYSLIETLTKIEKVKANDIITAAKTMILDTVYIYTQKGAVK